MTSKLHLIDGTQIAPLVAPCKICGQSSDLFDVVDAGKSALPSPFRYGLVGMPVYFYRCECCGFCFRNDWDDWQHEEFKEKIYNDDYINFDPAYAEIRPAHLSEYFLGRLRSLPRDVAILDFGAGSSCFADHMIAGGFANVQSYDPFSGHRCADGLFDIIISTEVLEHVPFPISSLTKMSELLKPDGLILFTTCLQPTDFSVQRGNWWYAAPRNGHGSLYTRSSLAEAGDRFGWEFWSDRHTVHSFCCRETPWRSALDGFARSYRELVLYAPSGHTRDASPHGYWHQTEQINGVPFKWSANASLNWKVEEAFQSQTASIILPLVTSMNPDDVHSLKLLAGNASVAGAAEATIYGHIVRFEEVLLDQELTVATPELLQPGPDDRRRLRIAVPTRDSRLALPV